MQIMPAGVHHWNLLTIGVPNSLRASVVQTCAFEDRESVHVCAKEDCLSDPVLENAHYALSANLWMYIEVQAFEMLLYDRCRAGLLQ